MSFTRWIREHRPTVTLTVLVALSLVSLATGTRAGFIHRALRTTVAVTAHPFLTGLKAVQNGVNHVTGMIFSYNATRRELDQLRVRFAESALASANQVELLEENQRLRREAGFMRQTPKLTLEPVDVITNFRGILKIDRGALHGIQESMAVLTEEGVVGLITEVDWTTATVVTLHNADCRIGAMARRNRVRGMVHGSGSDLSNICTMEYIDMKDDIRPGDLVVTSPESLFPAGYPIGTIEAVHDTESLWKYAEVKPAVDPYRIDEVFVVRRATPPSEEPGSTSEEEAPPVTPPGLPMPDNRSIQERFAP